ncbi:hypothetical protein [Methyloferula stellata]|uniref:hypothetical protein n=1 Tax=Methyloferula stellata TaxID=876270 RepID=UPI0003A3611C|nr:hypothetical protein [Methyloferula stellata]
MPEKAARIANNRSKLELHIFQMRVDPLATGRLQSVEQLVALWFMRWRLCHSVVLRDHPRGDKYKGQDALSIFAKPASSIISAMSNLSLPIIIDNQNNRLRGFASLKPMML